MGKLDNSRWELFAVYTAEGHSRRDAYWKAGYETKSAALASQKGSALYNRPEVKARVAEIREALTEQSLASVGVDREYVLRELRENHRKASIPSAKGKVDIAGSNRALELMGKEIGMFVERHILETLDSELDGMNREELRTFVRAAASEVGLRVVDMNYEEARDWIVHNAPKYGLRAAPEGGTRSDGTEVPEDGELPTLSEAGGVSRPRTH